MAEEIQKRNVADVGKESYSSGSVLGVQNGKAVTYGVNEEGGLVTTDKALLKTDKVSNENLTFGEVKEGDANVVSGGDVYKSLPVFATDNLFKKDLLVFGKSVNSAGNVVINEAYSKRAIIERLKLKPETKYTIGNYSESESKNLSISDVNGISLFTRNAKKLPLTFTTTATHFYLNALIKFDNDIELSSYEDTIIVEGDILETYITSINNSNIKDKKAVSIEYFNNNAIKESDLTITKSNNLANEKYKLLDFMVADAGIYPNRVGWVSFGIPITPDLWGKNISFGNFKINEGGYSCFYKGSENKNNNGSYSTPSLPKTYKIPNDVDMFYISVKRPTNTDEDFKNIIINIGTSLIDYVEPIDTITSIKGYKIAGSGGDSFDQQLNTYNNVEFNKIKALAMNLDLPTSSVGLENGDVYVDNLTLKVKG